MIPLSKPYFDECEQKAVSSAIASGWVTQGPKVKEFEDAFAQYVGAKYACAVSNCTTALHAALLTVGVKPGDIVITVSHSFIATANAIRACGAEPAFIDIDAATLNCSLSGLRHFLRDQCEPRGEPLYFKNIANLLHDESPLIRIKSEYVGRIAAILIVHQIGYPADMPAIVDLARQYNLPVVEDAACAIGSKINIDGRWEHIGKPHGDIACFSFHPRKILTTGDGGMLTTNNSVYDQKLRLLRHHGMSVSDLERTQKKQVVFEEYVTTAYNYRMTDLQAAMGLEQLKKLNDILAKYRQIVLWYRQAFKHMEWVQFIEEQPNVQTNWQSLAVRLPSSMDRDKVMAHLLDNGIATRRGIMNAHQEKPYAAQRWVLPESERARREILLLPIFYAMTHMDVQTIAHAFEKVSHG